MSSSSTPVTLADVLRSGFGDYERAAGPLPAEHYKVAHAIMDCRTPALGGRMYRCEECGHSLPVFNSCRDRHCPQCQAMARARWVEKRLDELLPIPYFHVVFTIPEQLKPFALRNKAPFYTLMFRAVADTLSELAANPRHLGGSIGCIAVLHTWTQTLMDHPHIHCVVPAGALADDRMEWLHCRKNFLFPIEVVKRLYRGKLMALFKEAVAAGDIQFHGLLRQQLADYPRPLDTLYQKDWVVYMKESFASPEKVIKYLGSYTNRIAIANSRIKALRGATVTFAYRDRRDRGREKLMTLPTGEFIRRFFLHVLPPGFVRIRYFGLLANRDRAERIEQCRMAISGGEELEPLIEAMDHDEPVAKQSDDAGRHHALCPHCGKGRLVVAEELPGRTRPCWAGAP
jgi:hypothetical protein